MKALRSFLNSFRTNGSRFDAYYTRVVGDGIGSPTADEARRDVRDRNRMYQLFGMGGR